MEILGKIKEDPQTFHPFFPVICVAYRLLLWQIYLSLKEANMQALLLKNRNVVFILYVVDTFH